MLPVCVILQVSGSNQDYSVLRVFRVEQYYRPKCLQYGLYAIPNPTYFRVLGVFAVSNPETLLGCVTGYMLLVVVKSTDFTKVVRVPVVIGTQAWTRGSLLYIEILSYSVLSAPEVEMTTGM